MQMNSMLLADMWKKERAVVCWLCYCYGFQLARWDVMGWGQPLCLLFAQIRTNDQTGSDLNVHKRDEDCVWETSHKQRTVHLMIQSCWECGYCSKPVCVCIAKKSCSFYVCFYPVLLRHLQHIWPAPPASCRMFPVTQLLCAFVSDLTKRVTASRFIWTLR